MYEAWLAAEHSRLHLIEQWPDGPRKEASLAAARSGMDGLLRSARSDQSGFRCLVCANRRSGPALVENPSHVQVFRSSDLAAA
jgi:hypothetical protein